MSRQLPARPNLDWLRKTAKERLAELRAANPGAQLAEAQLIVARDHGFTSWRRMKAHIDRLARSSPAVVTVPSAITLPEEAIARFFELVGTGRIDEVKAGLAEAPAMARAVGPHPFWGGRPQALHLSIEGKRRDMFDLLLEHGADVNGVNDGYDYWSPLMLAVHKGQQDMTGELLLRGARVGLLEALLMGDDVVVAAELGDGPLPDLRPNGGSLLAFARTPFAIDRLLALGAPVDLKDRWGSTPIDALSRMGPTGRALVDHLVMRGVQAAPKEYARLGDLDTLAALVAADPSVARMESVMMAAVDFGHAAIVDWLLARDGPVNARSDAPSRHTALHSAAWNGDLDMVKRLVAAGADHTIRDEQYDAPPAGWAETSGEIANNPNCAKVAEYLTSLGG